VEHPYGTIKRQWGFDHVLTKKYLERASADIGFMFIAYNLKRIINIMGSEAIKEYLKTFLSLNISNLCKFGRFLRVLTIEKFQSCLINYFFDNCLKRLILT
jgi:hypothetical protein